MIFSTLCTGTNHITVKRYHSTDSYQKRLWVCECVCGKELIVPTGKLLSRKSCGCVRGNPNRTHGRSSSREYVSWYGMKNRCLNPNGTKYGDYGGRGITVCDSWLKFENFYADMGDRPEGKSLDRIDVNGNYEPSNCRWATASEQQRNKRKHVGVVALCLLALLFIATPARSQSQTVQIPVSTVEKAMQAAQEVAASRPLIAAQATEINALKTNSVLKDEKIALLESIVALKDQQLVETAKVITAQDSQITVLTKRNAKLEKSNSRLRKIGLVLGAAAAILFYF